jgi:hypothetical protein
MEGAGAALMSYVDITGTLEVTTTHVSLQQLH